MLGVFIGVLVFALNFTDEWPFWQGAAMTVVITVVLLLVAGFALYRWERHGDRGERAPTIP